LEDSILRKRLFRVFLPAAVAIGVPAYLWAATFGGFGARLAQAQETGFFKWFHLTQTAREKTAGVTVTSFKPSGQKFRDLVTFQVTTGQDGGLTGMRLILKRAFVDSPRDGIFARDITKSLLGTVFSSNADQELQALIQQIEYLGTSTSPILRHESMKPPPLPAQPTPGYLAYLGKQQSYDYAVAGKTLRLENATVEGKKALLITIHAQ
jgi:hypothetical protein